MAANGVISQIESGNWFETLYLIKYSSLVVGSSLGDPTPKKRGRPPGSKNSKDHKAGGARPGSGRPRKCSVDDSTSQRRSSALSD